MANAPATPKPPPGTATRSCVIPCLQYRDALAAIDWLVAVFGFEAKMVVPGETRPVAHAELVLGDGMIMLGSAEDPEQAQSAYSRHMTHPDRTGGLQTQSIYLVVEDADEVHARAVAADARILIDLKDEDYGGRGFTCLDLEGHLWSVGTYNPR